MIDEILKFQHLVEQRANQLHQDIFNTLISTRADITGKLATLQADILKTDFNLDTPTRKRRLLKAQQKAIDEVINEIFKQINVEIKSATTDTIEATAIHTKKHLIDIGPKLILPTMEKWFEMSTVDGLLVNEMLDKLETTTKESIIQAARKSLIKGDPADKLARAIRDQGIAGKKKGFEGIARTLIMSANNYARDQLIKENYADVVKGWMYCATLDRKTCLVCAADDGKTFSLNENKPVLPQHFNCRCCYIPFIDRKREKGNRPYVKESFERYVNHRDGTRSKKYNTDHVGHFKGTYQEWLTQQLEKDPTFVKEILGEKRFKLFSKGKLKLDAMTTNGRVKKLSEMVN